MQLNANNKNAAVKLTKTIESILSRSPPWPGINVPESLTPEFRFILLSTRSPITPAIAHIIPKDTH